MAKPFNTLREKMTAESRAIAFDKAQRMMQDMMLADVLS